MWLCPAYIIPCLPCARIKKKQKKQIFKKLFILQVKPTMVFLRWRSGRIVSFTNAGGRAPCVEPCALVKLTIRPLRRLKITIEVVTTFKK
jgi:hypothetical protein